MALTLAQLVDPGTAAQAKQQVLDGMAGRSVVTKNGAGTGSCSIAGTPLGAYSVVLQIALAGEPGTAHVQVSTDGGATYGVDSVLASSGIVAVTGTGITATLAAGPSGAGTSFALGDTFSFSTFVPSLPTMAWQDGSVPKTLALAQGQLLADQRALIATIARGGYVTSQPGVTGASGPWLDLAAKAAYGLDRNPALVTVGSCLLTDAASAGPFTIAVGQLWITTAAGLRFTNRTGGTLAQGGTLALTFAAESPGAAYNLGNGTPLSFVTSLPGVTVTNPDPGTGTWITTQGVDTESDLAYATRAMGMWSALGTGSPAAAYDSWARTASSEVTRTRVYADPNTGGQVNLYVAGPSGPVSGGAVTAVVAAVTPKIPLCSTLNCASAVATAITVAGTVNILAAYWGAAQAAIDAAVGQYLSGAFGSPVYLSQVIAAINTSAGVRDSVSITLNGSSSETLVLGANAVATFSDGMTYVKV